MVHHSGRRPYPRGGAAAASTLVHYEPQTSAAASLLDEIKLLFPPHHAMGGPSPPLGLPALPEYLAPSNGFSNVAPALGDGVRDG